MTIHKEGYISILITILFVIILNVCVHYFLPYTWARWITYGASAFLLIMILQFFRHPLRILTVEGNSIIAPADGKVVVIEEVEETEYLKDKRLQISIFMSPVNVHVNRYPVSGIVKYVKYHAGLYLVAWHPKSSTDNERTTIVVEHKNGHQVLFRQIAGALARRIVYSCKENDEAVQGAEFGFIKFGSRVDVILPKNVEVKVSLNQVVKGGQTVIATFA